MWVPCQIAACDSELPIEDLLKRCLVLITDNSRCEFLLDLAGADKANMRWFDIWGASIAADVRKSDSESSSG